jgi:hypothetical protein
MLEVLERQTKLTADWQKSIAAAGAGDISPKNTRRERPLSSRDRSTPQEGDGCVTCLLEPGHWPRVFPGL